MVVGGGSGDGTALLGFETCIKEKLSLRGQWDERRLASGSGSRLLEACGSPGGTPSGCSEIGKRTGDVGSDTR